MGELRVGTCSWKYPSWHRLVYSSSKGVNYLEEYAAHYDTVEIDQWFWSLFPGSPVKLPRPADARAYRSSVPDSFRFSIKIPNSVTLTHYYRKRKADPLVPNPSFLSSDLFRAFLSSIEPLHDVLGPLMFQFEYLNRQKMRSLSDFLARFEEFAQALPTGFRYGLEIRNPNYLIARYFEFLKGRDLSPVFLQGYYMPPITDVFQRWR